MGGWRVAEEGSVTRLNFTVELVWSVDACCGGFEAKKSLHSGHITASFAMALMISNTFNSSFTKLSKTLLLGWLR